MTDSERWPIGVFASIDAGLGVRLDVARELGVTAVHLHTPHRKWRTPQRAAEFRRRLDELGVRVTCVFAGFDGESYADIPTVADARMAAAGAHRLRAARPQQR
ncbi:MAG TPA: hypothetical protein PJ982_06180 [Lacipirellulaceae bacterium]|nr:hypothetical protein [Lacipirellulaceae bacterium]